MKASQIRISRNVKFFADRMKQKYDLVDFSDTTKPAVIYGVYNPDDIAFIESFEPFAIVLWRGTDAQILNADKASRILRKKNCRHIAASETVYRSLLKYGIKSEIIPITSTSLSIKPEPKGKYVYAYVCSNTPTMIERYHVDWLKKIQQNTKLKFMFTYQRQHDFKTLLSVYRRCFVGIRLLDHDGMSNSILEMGLMGRRTISNSGLPHTIPWKNIKDIEDKLLKEYKLRRHASNNISVSYRKLIDIGTEWLKVLE